MGGKLTVLGIKALTGPGRYVDGGGLHLHVRGAERRAWVFRYTRHGMTHDMGLGPYPEVSLSKARQAADEARSLLRAKKDPLQARQAEAEPTHSKTFEDAATDYIAVHSPSWVNEKHVAQWDSTLKTHAYPVIGRKSVADITVSDILRVLNPIWSETPETASRLRGRLESILDFARNKGWRVVENPARWKGSLQGLLPPKARIARVAHQPSLPWEQLPAFIKSLRGVPGLSARALEFIILTAARTGEVRGMRWSEVDLKERLWAIPPDRMKAKRLHRVPLSEAAIQLLRSTYPSGKMPDAVEASVKEELVFPSPRAGKLLSDMAISMTVRRMNGECDPPTWRDISGRAIVPHGFRSSFRVWAGEETAYPREVVETALAHVMKDKVEAAYARTDLLERRRPMMEEWGKVVQP
jgi:integrase